MTVYRYACYGHVVESEISIPGGVPLAAETTIVPDVIIALGSVAPTQADQFDPAYQLNGTRMAFGVPHVARYACIAGTSIIVEPLLGADPSVLGDYLIATALPMLIWMRGGFVLHGGAVVMPGSTGAIAIAGPSGAGKSTVIGALCQRGAGVVGDDTLSLTIKADIMISGLPSGYFTRMSDMPDRIAIAVPPEQIIRYASLRALIVIEPSAAGSESKLTRLTGVAALEALLKNRHRARIPALLGRERDIFQFCLLLRTRLPIYTVTRKDGDIQGIVDIVTALAETS